MIGKFTQNIRAILIASMESRTVQFPQGFYWGSATSSHQIEGGLHNDWTEWEQSPRRLAFLRNKGLEPTEFISGLGGNSWQHLEDDITCLKMINSTAYRFSLEWSRIEPEEGRFDQAALQKYRDFIIRLRAEGIEPFVTIWHWSLPVWVRDRGGWTNQQIVKYFTRYSEQVAHALPEVKFWLTINEPNIYAGKSYLQGDFPPQRHNIFSYLTVTQRLIAAHRAIYQAIKKINPEAQVGIVTNNIDFDSAGGVVNNFLARCANRWWNEYILECIKDCQDIIGLNFYFHNRINYGFNKNENHQVSDMGWELYPQSIKPVLLKLKKYHKPIYITESGLADEADVNRAWYIKGILTAVAEAIAEGVDVRGYFYWSLLDNFEWAEGFAKKFGLFSVNRQTYERTARPSAAVYGAIAKTNSFTT